MTETEAAAETSATHEQATWAVPRPPGRPWTVLAVVSAGGALGSLARYGVGQAFPSRAAGFPWATFTVNVTGCLLIGALMVVVTDVWGGRRLVRPFLGVGVLGGYTTFSTYVVDVQRLVDRGAAGTGLLYLAGTLLAALLAVYAGSQLTQLATRPPRLGRERDV
ncbi:MAG: fluoride exporter [Micromonosporaceae bacterium]